MTPQAEAAGVIKALREELFRHLNIYRARKTGLIVLEKTAAP